jgi:hypothetical protein
MAYRQLVQRHLGGYLIGPNPERAVARTAIASPPGARAVRMG